MSAAAALLAEARRLGVAIRAVGGRVRLATAGEPPPADFLERVAAAKAELLAALAGPSWAEAVRLVDLLAPFGGMVRVENGRLRVLWTLPPPPELLDALAAREAELRPFLDGARCRYCGGPVDWSAPADWRTPAAVALADGTAVHGGCRDRLFAERAADPKHARDPAEVGLRGGPPLRLVEPRAAPGGERPSHGEGPPRSRRAAP